MDDSAQSSNQPGNAQQQPLQQPVQGTQQPVPSVPQGSVHKEHAPAVTTNEYVQPAPHEATPHISEEVAAHVEVARNPEQPQLSQEHRKLGFSEAKETTPAPAALSDDNAFPLTQAQVTQSQQKQYSVWDSFKWFGATVGRQMLRARQALFKEDKR